MAALDRFYCTSFLRILMMAAHVVGGAVFVATRWACYPWDKRPEFKIWEELPKLVSF